MKVKLITPLQDKEGKDVWRIDFEESDKAMWAGFSPSFSVGHIIDDDKLQPSKSGKSWIFKRKQQTETTPQPLVSPTGEKTRGDEILVSVAFKGAVECDGYWYVPDGKSHEDRVLLSAKEMYIGLKSILGDKNA